MLISNVTVTVSSTKILTFAGLVETNFILLGRSTETSRECLLAALIPSRLTWAYMSSAVYLSISLRDPTTVTLIDKDQRFSVVALGE